jgi:hypothetical protein
MDKVYKSSDSQMITTARTLHTSCLLLHSYNQNVMDLAIQRMDTTYSGEL